MPMRKLGDESVARIVEGAKGLRGAMMALYAKETAAYYGVTISTINRLTRSVRATRKRRADAGAGRLGISDATIDLAMALIWSENYTVKRCVEIMKRDGHIPADRFSNATMTREIVKRLGAGASRLRALREEKNGVVRPHRTVHFRYRAPHPNHTWQWDATLAGQFYIDHKGGLGYQSPDEVRKNKPLTNPKGRMLWIFGVKDDFSGMVFYRGFPFMNSTCFNEFMFIAMKSKEAWPWFFPLHGRPEHFRTDGDGRVLCEPSQRWMRAIGIEHETAKKNPNWNGKIERSFLTSQDIQNSTRLHKLDLNWFNLMLLDFSVGYNLTPSRALGGERPLERYISNAGVIRTIPDRELWDRLFYDEADCLIAGDLSYRLMGNHLQLPDVAPFNEMANLHATIRWNRYELDKITVLWQGREYEAPIIEWREFSTAEHYHWPKANRVEQTLDRIAGIDTATAVNAASKWGHHLADNKNVIGFWNPQTEPVMVEAPADPVISISDALDLAVRRLVGGFGCLTPQLAAEFKSRLSGSPTRAEVEKVLSEMAAIHAVEM